MEKFRTVINFIWRKAFIFVPATMLVFFLHGFFSDYRYLKELKENVLYRDIYNEDLKEIYCSVYDNFSDEYIKADALTIGIARALFYPAVIFYGLMVVTFLISKRPEIRSIGIVLAIVTAVVLAGYIYFVRNFKLVF